MDEYFNEFLIGKNFAPIIDSLPVDENTLSYYQGKLPDRLLGYWKDAGFAGYGEGIFWTINPNDYQDIVEKWLTQTKLWGRENFYAIARTAFGELYIRGDKSDSDTIINPHLNNILPGDFEVPPTIEVQDRGIGIFFMTMKKSIVDYRDKNEKLLFQRCLKKYGMLEHDEIYTFSTPLALCGTADINNIKKVKIFEQLSMLCDLDTPVILPSPGELFGPI